MISPCTLRHLGFALTMLAVAAAPVSASVRQVPPVATPIAVNDVAQASRLYIVQLDEPPALSLIPRESGPLRAATQGYRERRARFNPDEPELRRHALRLRARQREVLAAVSGAADPVYNYSYTFNGMAVKLTPRQAEQLRLRKGVTQVWEDRRRRVATSDSPEFLGLLDASGGLRTELGLQGENVIIGIIDSGIAPGHPSVAERAAERDKPSLCRSAWAENSLLGQWLCRRFKRPGNSLYGPAPANWRGVCQTGEGFQAEDCNNKLIGARFYNEGFLAEGPADPNEFASPADADGHGTHIASIAAGNTVEANVFGRDAGRISGMAPRARVAVYKACWLEPGGFRATCSVADLQAAIEDAVADGVDIINYSIGSLDDSLTDPDDLALLAAAEAGVLSVVASGNNGPEPFTILAPATTPWVISVGASSRTGTRIAEGLRVNKPAAVAADYENREASFTPRLKNRGPVTGDLVLARDGMTVTDEGEIGTVFDACSPLTNGDEISGEIAFIQRGACDFDTKVRFAQDAGAVAVVVFNNDAELVVMAGDSFGVNIPAVMIGQADGQLLRDRLADNETVEITLDKSIFINFSEAGNVMGTFSGRGPSLGDPDFLKPDVVAPGVNILGGNTPDIANGFRGENFQYLSGTSQSAPHVAGIAALLKEAHPDWTPAALKSALMTSSRQNIRAIAGGEPANPFLQGAGHIVPNSAFSPGLIYDVNTAEYDAYLCAIGLPRLTDEECNALDASAQDFDARDINLPSLAITELVTSATVQRRVRNVGPAATFTASVTTPNGIELEVSPASLTLGPDEEAGFLLNFSSDGSNLGDWQFGSYVWASDEHTVYSPFAVRPAELAVTGFISAMGASGSAGVQVDFGYNGDYRAGVFGLQLPCVLPDNNLDDEICTNTGPAAVANDPFNNYEFTDPPPAWVSRFFLNVSADNDAYFRISLFDELTDGDDDLDLYLYYCVDNDNNGVCEAVEFIDTSQGANTSNETIEVVAPPAGVYILDVHGYSTDPAIGGPTARFCVYSWAFGAESPTGNLTVSGDPGIATAGTRADLLANWSGLDDGLWLGGVSHLRGATPLGLTVLAVDNNALPAPPADTPFTCP